ncbi:iron-containing alcohol dehydrogenase [Anaerobium acetethylicum]|uniref:4-hydroxybutyrate dehydrogenase n=1 Tax=Anaerobium acetethylicum TaxID=1619234 RepID=A0A1D3TV36_9FIRM|nr:iron-containing alcohol dehydrogenase [Anaerobium acetethylicum]SCP97986.1 4-hydroxybutyrate dehydrogenase [Anaerobium acetethylicum]
MSFVIRPVINMIPTFEKFITDYSIGEGDLIITNEYVLASHIVNTKLTCDVLYQERYGSGEPTDVMIDAILEEIHGKGYKRIIAIGGGTVLDISKLLLFEEGLSCEQICEQLQILSKKKKLIAVPTTCGTGSEVTPIAVVHFMEKDTKIGMSAPSLAADEAVLIEDMFKTLPYGVFAASSIDALVHAVEAYVSPKADAFSKMFSQEAIKKILNGYKKIAEQGTGHVKEVVGDIGIASCFAGIAFGNAGVANVHAISHTIGSALHIPHGQANYLVFAQVFRKYEELGVNLSELNQFLSTVLHVSEEAAWEELSDLLDKILPRKPLKEFGMSEQQIQEFATSTVINQQRLLQNAQVLLRDDDIYDILAECY